MIPKSILSLLSNASIRNAYTISMHGVTGELLQLYRIISYVMRS